MDELLDTISKDKWARIGTHKRAGVLAPLFSVYSKNSLGIADLDDLKLLIDWCAKSGLSILQLLPMNEVGHTFCPYDTVSSFALEPSYIALNRIPASGRKSIKEKIAKVRKAFPAGKGHVDYRIKDAKLRALWDIYFEEDDCRSAELKKFINDNSYWLEDFALFKVLKGYHKALAWYEWPSAYMTRNADELKKFRGEHEREIDFHKWVQWRLYEQLKDARKYAAAKGVFVKGDLPILISRDSADVWAHQGFFKLGYAAGAPPDMYCAKGQRWGMPTYDWERIAADRYRYLKEKLRYAENFYDILRVDHAVGLFRIWSIPYREPFENEALNGSFDPADEKLWRQHGRTILSVMCQNTRILLCAEDLGIIPKECPETLGEFGIPGNDVQRWVKDWNVKHDFLDPKDYRRLAVAMLSTHDTTNWAAWWENEAGTIDEALFMRKCADRKIDYDSVKGRLFDLSRSRHGRLRWLGAVDSVDVLARALGKPPEELKDFIELYENTFGEKEKLWKKLGMKARIREKADPEMVRSALKITLASRAVFCIELFIDYLYSAGIFKGDPYKYRVNRPGAIARSNWSLTMPVPLEELSSDKICHSIKNMIISSHRAGKP